jgi:hypothetical protein
MVVGTARAGATEEVEVEERGMRRMGVIVAEEAEASCALSFWMVFFFVRDGCPDRVFFFVRDGCPDRACRPSEFARRSCFTINATF